VNVLSKEQVVEINQLIDERVRKLLNDVLARADEAVNGALPPAGEAPQPAQPKTTVPYKKVLTEAPIDFNPDLCDWEDAEGARGPFQVCKTGQNFTYLLKHLEAKEGRKATLQGLFYWVMTEGDAVGRKKVH
jgi:hypothetical protein